MKLRLLGFTLIFLVILFGALFIHTSLAEANQWHIGFHLHHVYYFFGFAGLLTYLILELAAQFVPAKIAYVFLTAIMMKLGFFIVLFLGGKVQLETASMASRLSIVVPLFLFLALEGISAYYVMQSIDQPNQSKES